MRSTIKKLGIAAVAVVSLVGATLATTSTADARGWHRGGGWGWGGGAFAGGLALGAIAAAPRYGYGYGYGYPAYAYGGDCVPERRVRHTPYGPVVRHVRVCY